jgi:hypothetical protein
VERFNLKKPNVEVKEQDQFKALKRFMASENFNESVVRAWKNIMLLFPTAKTGKVSCNTCSFLNYLIHMYIFPVST